MRLRRPRKLGDCARKRVRYIKHLAIEKGEIAAIQRNPDVREEPQAPMEAVISDPVQPYLAAGGTNTIDNLLYTAIYRPSEESPRGICRSANPATASQLHGLGQS